MYSLLEWQDDLENAKLALPDHGLFIYLFFDETDYIRMHILKCDHSALVMQ